MILHLTGTNYMTGKSTFDTNILIYAFGKSDDERKHIAKDIISKCDIISLQVLNETIYVLTRKYGLPAIEAERILEFMKRNFIITDLNFHILEKTLELVRICNFAFWDRMILASALNNNCSIIYSEDFHHELILEERLQIINPFNHLKVTTS